MARTTYDCMTCGACCTNTHGNREKDYRWYVEVEKRDKIRKNEDLMRRLTVLDEGGSPHMQLVGREQRCIALEGTVGKLVSCSIYEWRPSGCKRVEAGSYACRKARRERGIGTRKRAR